MKLNRLLVSVLVLFLFIGACSKKSEESDLTTQDSKTVQAKVSAELFTAKFPDGKVFKSTDYIGQRLVLGFFSIGHKDSPAMLKALVKLKPFQKKYNFKIFLVNIDYDKTSDVPDFLKDIGVDLPVILEGPQLAIAEKFKVENEVSMIGLSTKHKPAFGIKRYAFADAPDGEQIFLDYVKERLSIQSFDKKRPLLGYYPKTTDFTATTLQGETIKLSDYLGKAVIVLFFSPKCPHCQNEMKYLKANVYPKYKEKGLEILAVSVVDLKGEMLKLYNSFEFTWPVISDPKRKIRNLFSSERAVPENFFIDKKGKIRLHATGYSRQKVGAQIMLINDMLGLPNKPVLSDKKYNGAEACETCHQSQFVLWSVSKHATAWKTLQIQDETNNTECVGCHSLGFEDAKGYKAYKNKKTGKSFVRVPPWLENVSCENCHGIGGPHVSGQKKSLVKANLEKLCKTCHIQKYTPDFNFDKMIKKVNHSDANHIMGLSIDERIKLVE